MDLQLDGRTAFISGSTRGIGWAAARALAAEGADVVLNGRTADAVEAAAARLATEVPDARVRGIAADFTSDADVERLLDDLGAVDVLVNNVGLFDVKPFDLVTDEEWRRYFEVNVMSGVRLARRLLPAMLRSGWGRVLFVSSESGVNVPAEMVHYGTTKTAMLSVANGLAKLTRGTAVTVNSLLGGPTYSDGVGDAVREIAEQQGLPEEQMKQAVIGQNQTSLLQRFIEPDEIASMVAFLASPRASAVNGSAVRVDGGVLTTIL